MAKYVRKPRWTKIEEQFILDNFLVMTDEELARKFRRTLKSVRRKRSRMGLEKPEGRLTVYDSDFAHERLFGINPKEESYTSKYKDITGWAKEFCEEKFGRFLVPHSCTPGGDYVILKWPTTDKWLYLTVGPERAPYAMLGDEEITPPEGIDLIYWCRRILEKSLRKELKENS